MPRKPVNGQRLLNSIVSDFEHQRPAMSKRQADELEAALHEQWSGTRRAALAALTVNGKTLIKSIAGKKVDQAAAIEKVRFAYSLRTYAERLRSFAMLMDGASTRISLAARWRDDYEAVASGASKKRPGDSTAIAGAGALP